MLIICLHIISPSDSIQSHSDNPQTPPRNLPDTQQTPQNMAHFDQSKAEMEKRADNADISVLFFGGCANFLAVYAQTN